MDRCNVSHLLTAAGVAPANSAFANALSGHRVTRDWRPENPYVGRPNQRGGKRLRAGFCGNVKHIIVASRREHIERWGATGF
jgi:hypothetical protein